MKEETNFGATIDEIKALSTALWRALSEAENEADKYHQLYAARQALQWVIDKRIAMNPLQTIMEGRIFAPLDTQEA